MSGFISLRSRVVASSRQVSSRLGEETVILNLADGVYYELDPVGSRIWAHLNTPRRVEEIRDALLEEYDVDPARCEHDLLVLLARLREHELVEVDLDRPGD